jgi:cytoskeletal protein CcmA (bactofilin family)
MGFFGKKEDENNYNSHTQTLNEPKEIISNDIIKTPVSNVSIIKKGINAKAEIEGEGSLIVGGNFEGNVTIADTVFIEKDAVFKGEINAKNVKIAGDFEGSIKSNAIEVTTTGKFNGTITSNKTFLAGFVKGSIKSLDSIEVLTTGIVEAKECKSKMIKIIGKLNGRVVASELLEIISGGSVEGEIITKGIRTEQGGSIIGNIQTYDPAKHDIQSEAALAQTNISQNVQIDPEIANLINIDPNDIQKYAKKEEKQIKRIDPKE